MSRTDKWEHRPDGWFICGRIERKARPAGRLHAVVEEELMELTDEEMEDAR